MLDNLLFHAPREDLAEETVSKFASGVDFAGEYLKSIVRECFHFSNNSIDGTFSGLLHLIQSPSLKNYYKERTSRLSSSKKSKKEDPNSSIGSVSSEGTQS
jgi:hypothetical protein